jgi:hypothetical protein
MFGTDFEDEADQLRIDWLVMEVPVWLDVPLVIGNVFDDDLLMVGTDFDDDEDYLRIGWLVIGALVWLYLHLKIGTDFDDDEEDFHLIPRVWSWRKFQILEGLALGFS